MSCTEALRTLKDIKRVTREMKISEIFLRLSFCFVLFWEKTEKFSYVTGSPKKKTESGLKNFVEKKKTIFTVSL